MDIDHPPDDPQHRTDGTQTKEDSSNPPQAIVPYYEGSEVSDAISGLTDGNPRQFGGKNSATLVNAAYQDLHQRHLWQSEKLDRTEISLDKTFQKNNELQVHLARIQTELKNFKNLYPLRSGATLCGATLLNIAYNLFESNKSSLAAGIALIGFFLLLLGWYPIRGGKNEFK